MKRLFDIVIVVLMTPLVVPVGLIVALLVRINLGSPVLFAQDRPGLHREIFRMYKFRTMTDARDSQGRLLPDDHRLTRFGRFLRASSLDELPGLWSVLAGSMSLVGPRPLLVQYLPLYNEQQARRHDVRPGITGLAQVNGRNAISWEEKFALDVEYVERHNIWLDLKILALTFWGVIRSKDINAEESVTMPAFTGSPEADVLPKQD